MKVTEETLKLLLYKMSNLEQRIAELEEWIGEKEYEPDSVADD